VTGIGAYAAAYAGGASVTQVLGTAIDAIDAADPVWITRAARERVLERARALDACTPAQRAALPLFGVPFAVKDNIDVAGMPTTAACPAFAYDPPHSATVVERLEAAGAVVFGKTNLDQFATGLVGVRSPYGVPRNPFDARYIPGGSSSGSAVAVARDLVAFALGTDTAGSGRVPAGFTATVGLKPTFGTLSAAGVVPACRSLDCVSIFARSVDDAQAVFAVAAARDARDPFSRAAPPPVAALPSAFAFAVPETLTFAGDAEAEASFARAIARLEAAGGTRVAVDASACYAAASLLYGDAFVAERTAAVGDFLAAHPDALLEVTRTIVEGGRRYSAVDAFRAIYRLRALRRDAEAIFAAAPVLVVPTSPTIYTLDEIAAEPFARNGVLGTYTNFVNFFDWCALAIPSDRYANGVPIGITLIAPAFHEARLADLARRFAPSAPENALR
jgi:allophanate hydrolase